MSGSASFSHVLADLIPWVFRTNSYIRVALMCSAVQWSAVQCSAVQCIAGAHTMHKLSLHFTRVRSPCWAGTIGHTCSCIWFKHDTTRHVCSEYIMRMPCAWSCASCARHAHAMRTGRCARARITSYQVKSTSESSVFSRLKEMKAFASIHVINVVAILR